ncbi:MAG: magnesium protoporphyrin IX methyltransferase [Pseudomonadota bacterium]
MAGSTTYQQRRGELEEYFDRTAADAWAKLTSDAPVSGVRATVRAGRDAMREQLLAWLPLQLGSARILDAGCGTGALSVAAAARGAEVTAIDLSPTLVQLADERRPRDLPGSIEFRTGDMLDEGLGEFDHVVCMDSLIHYRAPDIVNALERLAPRVRRSMVITFAPKTAALAAMHTVGRLFPRGDRAPAIEPVSEANLRRLIERSGILGDWQVANTRRISSGFYTSQAMELRRS